MPGANHRRRRRPLTLQDAEALAIKNHPQVQAAQLNYQASQQAVAEARAAYYPTLEGDVTGSQANPQARIGAGYLTASRLWDRFGQGITLSQLITDSGRTRNLVASSRLQAQASSQTYQATRYDVLLRVNQAYFEALQRASAGEGGGRNRGRAPASGGPGDRVGAEQAALATGRQLRFGEPGAGETAADPRAGWRAAGLRGTDAGAGPRPAADLQAERGDRCRPVRPRIPREMVAQAFQQRPELAGLRLERESAYRFERAEHDLSYPTVSLIGVGGFIPYIHQLTAVAHSARV